MNHIGALKYLFQAREFCVKILVKLQKVIKYINKEIFL